MTGEAALAELAGIYGLPGYRTTSAGTGKIGSGGMGPTGFEEMERKLGFDQAIVGVGGKNPFPLISDVSDPNIQYSPIVTEKTEFVLA